MTAIKRLPDLLRSFAQLLDRGIERRSASSATVPTERPSRSSLPSSA